MYKERNLHWFAPRLGGSNISAKVGQVIECSHFRLFSFQQSQRTHTARGRERERERACVCVTYHTLVWGVIFI